MIMSDTTEIEKKSLEAHVELCAERYRYLEEKLGSMDNKIETVVDSVAGVKDAVERMAEKSNERILSWGAGIIVCLIGLIGYLLATYVLPPLP